METFDYDVLNRLNTATLSGTNGGDGTVTTSYDVLGDIVCKSDVTASTCSPSSPGYTYGQGGEYPHAVTAVAGTVNGIANPSYHYDDVGNMDGRAGTQVMWNSLNLPICMDMTGSSCAGTSYSKFSYAPDKHRYQQVTVDSSGNTETTVYAGGVEFLTTGTTTVARHMLSAYGENVLSINIGDSACSTTMESICFNYLNSDQLGGVDAVTDVTGATSPGTSFGYSAFGGRRDPVTGAAPTAAQVQADRAVTHRGFTKHEMLDNLNLIHMNGRVYDPALGRFLSVDPVYQAPTNMQSLNPYSYVMNNPLSLVDPSGYVSESCTNGNECSKDSSTGSTTTTATVTAKVTLTPTGSHVAQTFAVTANVSITTASGNNGNGEENQDKGAGSTLATSQDQGAGTGQVTANTATTINEKSGAGGGAKSSCGSCSAPFPPQDATYSFAKANKDWKDNGKVKVSDDDGTTVITIRLSISGPHADEIAAAVNSTWNGATGTYDGKNYRADVQLTAVASGGDWRTQYFSPSELRSLGEETGGYLPGGKNEFGSSILKISSGWNADSYIPGHEFGHALGLTHAPAGSGSIMSYDSTRAVLGKELSLVATGYGGN